MRADDRAVGAAAANDGGGLEPGAQNRDPPLEQSLFVLGGVVLEVLGEIAVTACGRDRLHDLGPLGPFELGELGRELGVLLGRELLVQGEAVGASSYGGGVSLLVTGPGSPRQILERLGQLLRSTAARDCADSEVSERSGGLPVSSGSSVRSMNRPPLLDPTQSPSETSTDPRRIVVVTRP